MRRATVTIRRNERGGHAAALPFDVREEFGSARASVRVTVNDRTFRTTTMRYGGVDYVGFNREVRERAGLVDGDVVELSLSLDLEPRGGRASAPRGQA